MGRSLTVGVVVPALRPRGAVDVLTAVRGECDAAVVVDNALGAVAEEVRAQAAWASIIGPARNLGFGAAVMLGVEQLETDVVVLINDDVAPRPGFVRQLAAAFVDPTVQQAAGLLVQRGGDQIDSVGLCFDRTLRAENAEAVRVDGPVPAILGPSGAGAAYRRRTFLELGGFAPELFAYWEDADLALRMWAAGHRCVFVTDAVADHARGTALQGRSARQRELDAFGRGFVLGRYASWLSPVERALVPVVDWPSLARGCLRTGNVTLLRARRAGRVAGRAGAPPPPRPTASCATRPVGATLRRQALSLRRGADHVAEQPAESHAGAA